MKDRETQLAFIRARAQGKSYSTISKELGIAKATCTSWEQSFKEDIAELKREQLEELYTSYNMGMEARIRSLGDIIAGLDTAIAGKSLDSLPVDKLLELRLKYWRDLRAEYIEPADTDTDDTLDGLLEQYNQLYKDSKAKHYTPADIKAQLSILDAKKAILFALADEIEKEEADPLGTNYLSGYTSKIIRHEEDLDA